MATVNIIGRITKLGLTVGYMVKDTYGNEFPLPKEDVLVMAQQNMVFNATAQKTVTSVTLKGRNGYNLTQLPIIKLTDEQKKEFSAEAKNNSTNLGKLEVYQREIENYKIGSRTNEKLINQSFKDILKQKGKLEFFAKSGNMELPIYYLDIQEVLSLPSLNDGVTLRTVSNPNNKVQIVPADFVPQRTGELIKMCCVALASLGDRGAIACCRCTIGNQVGEEWYMWGNNLADRQDVVKSAQKDAEKHKKFMQDVIFGGNEVIQEAIDKKETTPKSSDRAKQFIMDLKSYTRMDMSDTSLKILQSIKDINDKSGTNYTIRGLSVENDTFSSDNICEDFYIIGQKGDKAVVVIVTIDKYDGYISGSEDDSEDYFSDYENVDIKEIMKITLATVIYRYFKKHLN